MKTKLNLILALLIAALWGCEKNDPLAEQGSLTGEMVPFNILAQMPDGAAGDTLNLRNVTWAIDDNIGLIRLSHSGFKLRNYEVKIVVPQTVNNVTTNVEMAATFAEDSIIFAKTVFAEYPEAGGNLNEFYQTLETAYVINYPFVVPAQYRLTKEKDADLINVIDEPIFQFFVNTFSRRLTRSMLLAIFPEISPFNLTYFQFDSEGFLIEELKEAGYQYFVNNITRERFNDFLKEASASDNTRVTLESEAALKGSTISTKSVRTFRVL